MVLAQCKAGIIGAFPSLNARPISMLDEWLAQITEELAAYDRALGLKTIRFDSLGRWGLTTSRVGDELELVRGVGWGRGPLNARSRLYVRTQMANVTRSQRWGVSAGPTAGVELKNGWLPLRTHGWRVNSIGHIRNAGRDYSIAVLTTDNSTMSYGVRTIEGASRIVFRALAPAS